MQFSAIKLNEITFDKNNLFVILVDLKMNFSSQVKKLERLSNFKIKEILKNSNFNSKFGQNILLRSSEISILLLGCGKALNSNLDSEKLGGILYSSTINLGFKNITIISNLNLKETKENKVLSKVLFGIKLKSYSFIKYKQKTQNLNSNKLYSIKVVTSNKEYVKGQIKNNLDIISGIFFAKDLISEPANILTTEEFVSQIQELTNIGVDVEILNEKQMSDLGMNALLGVGKGSKSKSFLIVMRWNGNPSIKNNIAFVGKGVCFDTGGLSLKTPRGMIDMKEDMGGAGIVVGSMKTIAKQKIKKNIVGVVGLVENMPGPEAQRPGDIVRSMSGKTIEILNTDAEGRLVLADALYYTNKFYKSDFIIDLATLTGSIVSALGNERAGLFSNNEKLSNLIFSIGEQTGNLVWKMPLDDSYGNKMISNIADLKNIGTAEGSSIQAATFLKHFVGRTAWAHLDVAGVVWLNKKTELHSGGATGWGVKLLFEIAKKLHF